MVKGAERERVFAMMLADELLGVAVGVLLTELGSWAKARWPHFKKSLTTKTVDDISDIYKQVSAGDLIAGQIIKTQGLLSDYRTDHHINDLPELTLSSSTYDHTVGEQHTFKADVRRILQPTRCNVKLTDDLSLYHLYRPVHSYSMPNDSAPNLTYPISVVAPTFADYHLEKRNKVTGVLRTMSYEVFHELHDVTQDEYKYMSARGRNIALFVDDVDDIKFDEKSDKFQRSFNTGHYVTALASIECIKHFGVSADVVDFRMLLTHEIVSVLSDLGSLGLLPEDFGSPVYDAASPGKVTDDSKFSAICQDLDDGWVYHCSPITVIYKFPVSVSINCTIDVRRTTKDEELFLYKFSKIFFERYNHFLKTNFGLEQAYSPFFATNYGLARVCGLPVLEGNTLEPLTNEKDLYRQTLAWLRVFAPRP